MALTIRTTGIEDYLDGGDAFIKVLMLGEPGCGKTRSSSFWPKPILADVEKGRMAVADRRIPYGEITSMDDMRAFIGRLMEECRKPVNERAYQTVVIDTLDAYQRILIATRLREARKEAFSGWEDWGWLDTKMQSFVTALMSLPMNVVVNLHIQEKKDGDDGPLVVRPRLKGDMKDQILGEFDLVGLMQTGWKAVEGERVVDRFVQWHPTPNAPILKDRSGRLPATTPITFTEQDYEGLFTPLIEALDSLSGSEDVETLATDDDARPDPVPPHAGGAVAQPQAAPAKRTAAKKAPAKAVSPAAPPAASAAPEGAGEAQPAAAPAPSVPPGRPRVPAAPRPTIEVVDKNLPEQQAPEASGTESAPASPAAAPAAAAAEEPRTDAVAETSDEAAAELVERELGATPVEAPAQPVDAGEAVDRSPAEQPAAAATEPAAPVRGEPQTPPPPADSKSCGQPGRKPDGSTNDNPMPGCGKDLSTEKPDVVNISLIKTGRKGRPTYLCPACTAAAMAAA